MFVRIRTIFKDYNRGRNYIFAPESIPRNENEQLHRDSDVSVSTERVAAESQRPVQPS